MLTSALFSSLHLIGLVLIMAAIFMRARSLRKPLDAAGLKRLFMADNLWGVAALVVLATGLTRVFTGLEKGPDYYAHSTAFWVKMGLFAAIVVLELWPMVTFIGWRSKLKQNQAVDTSKARVFAIFSDVQTLFALLMIFSASIMARAH